MKLISIAYFEDEGTSHAWTLDRFEFGPANLIVGQNSSGKSRVINIIHALASMLSGKKRPGSISSCNLTAEFESDGQLLRYTAHINNRKVDREQLKVGEVVYIDRGESGKGSILSEADGKHFDIQPPSTELAAFARRDAIQHPLLEKLAEWGEAVYLYRFGTDLGKTTLGIKVLDGTVVPPVDIHDTAAVVAIVSKGIKEFGDSYAAEVVSDFNSIGYNISSISIGPLVSATVHTSFGEPVGLRVQENDLMRETDQHTMSSGMFRALSIVAQVCYVIKGKLTACILIDDVGEGLDYERSTAMIKLLLSKASASGIQLIMSSNDRFVMNVVPLESWNVLRRRSSEVHVLNYKNSAEVFDRFRFTGLNNFDLLATGFLDDWKDESNYADADPDSADRAAEAVQDAQNGDIRRGTN